MEYSNSTTGLKHFLQAFGFSLAGIRAAWRHEAAFRQEVFMMAVLFPLGLFLGRDIAEKVLLILPCFLVLAMELVNSAIEAVVDRVGREHHELAGMAKDLGSAAVFVSLGGLAVTWGLIFLDRILT